MLVRCGKSDNNALFTIYTLVIIALNALQVFQVIFGLKVNIEKTKIIKIGVWGDSRANFC